MFYAGGGILRYPPSLKLRKDKEASEYQPYPRFFDLGFVFHCSLVTDIVPGVVSYAKASEYQLFPRLLSISLINQPFRSASPLKTLEARRMVPGVARLIGEAGNSPPLSLALLLRRRPPSLFSSSSSALGSASIPGLCAIF